MPLHVEIITGLIIKGLLNIAVLKSQMKCQLILTLFLVLYNIISIITLC